MDGGVEIARVELTVPPGSLASLGDFYASWGSLRRIAFVEADGSPFHHFALRVPGDRFVAAREWLAERAPLAFRPAQGDATFDFQNIDARAVYVVDPAGNIVELIAHAGLDEAGMTGPFDPSEIGGVAEIGLVVADRAAAVATLAAVGLRVWSGDPDPDRLQFAGARGASIILASPGRGWLPTGRPAEVADAVVDVEVDGRAVRVVCRDGVVTAVAS